MKERGKERGRESVCVCRKRWEGMNRERNGFSSSGVNVCER